MRAAKLSGMSYPSRNMAHAFFALFAILIHFLMPPPNFYKMEEEREAIKAAAKRTEMQKKNTEEIKSMNKKKPKGKRC